MLRGTSASCCQLSLDFKHCLGRCAGLVLLAARGHEFRAKLLAEENHGLTVQRTATLPQLHTVEVWRTAKGDG